MNHFNNQLICQLMYLGFRVIENKIRNLCHDKILIITHKCYIFMIFPNLYTCIYCLYCIIKFHVQLQGLEAIRKFTE